jgi:hypothetical protein
MLTIGVAAHAEQDSPAATAYQPGKRVETVK